MTPHDPSPRAGRIRSWWLHAALLLVFALLPNAVTADDSGSAPAGPSRSGRSDPAPNILLYVVDTLRADALSAYGNPIVQTPRIARFANEAVLFERTYAPSSWTRPSILSLVTGLAPDLHGVETRGDFAYPGLRFLAETLREAGYRTGAIVTNPNVGVHYGFDQGYDAFQELFDSSDESFAHTRARRSDSGAVTDAAIDWIDSGAGPFFLFVLTTDPHNPYDPPEGYRDSAGELPKVKEAGPDLGPAAKRRLKLKRSRMLYYGEVAFNDASFGRLLDHLRSRGLYEETAVVFTSDHGEAFGEHSSTGHGHTLFDEVLRVPLIVRRPHETEAGRRVASPVQLLDVHPTLLSVAGLAIPPGLEGVSLFEARPSEPRSFYARLHLDGRRGEMILSPPWKLITPSPVPEASRPMAAGFYHLDDDPGERADLRSGRPEPLSRMQTHLAERGRRSERLARGIRAQGDVEAGAVREMPADVRRALIALGYLDSEGAPADPGASPVPPEADDAAAHSSPP